MVLHIQGGGKGKKGVVRATGKEGRDLGRGSCGRPLRPVKAPEVLAMSASDFAC